MLFLAVFCGFLAENFREHTIEKERERKYMQSLARDVKADVSLINQLREGWQNNYDAADSLYRLIAGPEIIKNSEVAVGYISDATVFLISYLTMARSGS
jgi:hypothetical protein